MERLRLLDIEGTWNVRDLGGYATRDGRSTRWATLLRGDAPSGLPAGSQRALLDFGVRTVIDLRKVPEVQAEPNDFARSPEVSYIHVDLVGDAPVTGTDFDPAEAGRKPFVNRTDVERVGYRDILDMRRAAVGDVLKALATPGALPGLIHCGIGKDRAGVIAGLALALAGVPDETIAKDYALSSRPLVELYLREQATQDEVASGYGWRDFQREYCPHDAMLEMLEHVSDVYGGAEAYALGAGLTAVHVARLRASFVE